MALSFRVPLSARAYDHHLAPRPTSMAPWVVPGPPHETRLRERGWRGLSQDAPLSQFSFPACRATRQTGGSRAARLDPETPPNLPDLHRRSPGHRNPIIFPVLVKQARSRRSSREAWTPNQSSHIRIAVRWAACRALLLHWLVRGRLVVRERNVATGTSGATP
jgi:hypothetical protein